jgi:DNA-binding transcriptional ArsR family regulator
MTQPYTCWQDVLSYIKENQGKNGVTQERIRWHFQVNPYGPLRKLTEKGLIRVERDERDRRMRRYYRV